jgi:hypothetical protein
MVRTIEKNSFEWKYIEKHLIDGYYIIAIYFGCHCQLWEIDPTLGRSGHSSINGKSNYHNPKYHVKFSKEGYGSFLFEIQENFIQI